MCDSDTIAAVLYDFINGKDICATKKLEKHRQMLFDELRQNQSQIDCLDYLVHHIERINTV